jgi:CheY-like chemotaxis protein
MCEAHGLPGRILFVEAHDDTREVLRRLLQPPFDVTACASGTEALRALARGTFVAAVVCPALRDMAFADFLAQLRAVADLPVVATTATAMARDMKDYERLKVAEVVVKPFDMAQLLSALNRAIVRKGGRWRAPAAPSGTSFPAMDFAQ